MPKERRISETPEVERKCKNNVKRDAGPVAMILDGLWMR